MLKHFGWTSVDKGGGVVVVVVVALAESGRF